MAEETIKITVGADTSQLNAELTKAQNNLKLFQQALAKSTNVDEIKYLQRNIGALQNQIGSLSNSLSGKFVSASGQATTTLTNLNRVVQDAPYGFIGIANNINPLIESFGRLKAESGSTGGAFKALLSSLTGPAGIGIAVAAVTTAITFAQIGFQRWTSSTQKAKEIADETKKAFDSIIQSQAKEVTNVSTLVAVLNSENETRSRKLSAIKELQQINPQIFKDLKLEGDTVVGLSSAYQDYIKNIQNVIAVKLIQQKLENAYTELIKLNGTAQTKAEKAASDLFINLNKSKIDGLKKLGDQGASAANQLQSVNDNLAADKQRKINGYTKTIEELQGKLQELSKGIDIPDNSKKLDKTKKSTETLTEALAKFEKSLVAIQSVGDTKFVPQFDINQDKIKEFESILTKLIEKFNKTSKSKVYVDLATRLDELQFQQVQIKLKNELSKIMRSAEDIPPIGIDIEINKRSDFEKQLEDLYRKGLLDNAKNLANKYGVPVPVSLEFSTVEGIKEFIKSFKTLEAKAIQQADALNGVLTSTAQNIAIGFGETLGKALAGNASIGDLFTGLFDQLGKGMVEFGKYIIQFAIKIELIKKAMFKNTALAIAGGIALIALGTLLQASLSKKQAFAVGTNYSPGGMALVGERGPEMVSLPRGARVTPAAQTAQMMGGAMQQVEVFGVLRGQDIYFSNKKYSQTYRRTT